MAKTSFFICPFVSLVRTANAMVCVTLHIVRLLFKWNHTIFILFFVMWDFHKHYQFPIFCAVAWIHGWLLFILLHRYDTIWVFILLFMVTVGVFQLLTITSDTSVSMSYNFWVDATATFFYFGLTWMSRIR